MENKWSNGVPVNTTDRRPALSASKWNGRTVRGKMIEKRVVTTSSGTSNIYTVETYDDAAKPTGVLEDYFGSNNLDAQWSEVEVGEVFSTKHLGEKVNPKTKRKFQEFHTDIYPDIP